jgi:hypothetical protein
MISTEFSAPAPSLAKDNQQLDLHTSVLKNGMLL